MQCSLQLCRLNVIAHIRNRPITNALHSFINHIQWHQKLLLRFNRVAEAVFYGELKLYWAENMVKNMFEFRSVNIWHQERPEAAASHALSAS